jgi:hypothetical protein
LSHDDPIAPVALGPRQSHIGGFDLLLRALIAMRGLRNSTDAVSVDIGLEVVDIDHQEAGPRGSVSATAAPLN